MRTLEREQATLIFMALGMMLTGLMLPFGDLSTSIPQALLELMPPPRFRIWCALLFACGAGMLVKPRYVLLWIAPLYIWLLAVTSISFTAFMYYLNWVVLPIATVYHDRIPFVRDFQRHQIMGVMQIVMGVGLVLNPNGSGMDFFYNALSGIPIIQLDPPAFYQGYYLMTGILLMSPTGYSKAITQALTSPYVVHGVTFIFVNFHFFKIYSLMVPMLTITLMLWTLGGRDEL